MNESNSSQILDEYISQLERESRIKSVVTSPNYFKESTTSNNNNNQQNPELRVPPSDNHDQWTMFKMMRSCHSLIEMAIENHDVKEEIQQVITLAEAYRENKIYGESFQALLYAKSAIEKMSNSVFDPQVEHLHVKILFLMGVTVLSHTKNIAECEVYLDSAQERAEELVRCISPSNVEINAQFSLIYEAKLAIQKNKSSDMLNFSRTLSTLLVPSLKTMILIGDEIYTVLNIHILQHTLFEISSCLIELEEFTLATRCLNLIPSTIIEPDEVLLKRVQSCHNDVAKKIELADAKKTRRTSLPPAYIPKVTVEKDDDSDDDGWPDSDDDRPSLGLSLGGNAKLTLSDSDDDEDSWGGALDDTDGGAPLAGLIDNSDEEEDTQSTSQIINEDIFPNRYRFFKSRVLAPAEDPANYEMSSLITLKMDDGTLSFKSSTEMFQWLGTIISKYSKSNEQDPEETDAKQANEVALLEAFQTNLTYMDAFSKKWAKEYYLVCWKLYHMRTRESRAQCWKLLSDYFSQLPNAKITKNVDQEDVQKLATIYAISLQMLHIAAFLWTPELMNSFKGMMDSINQFNPRQSDAVTMVEMKALCHHLKAVSISSKKQECARIVPTLLQIFEKHYRKASLVPNANGIIGNSKTHMKKIASSVEIATEALLVFHQYMCNMSPLTLDPLLTSDDNIQVYICDEELQKHELFELWNRFTVLESLYCKLNYYSPLKAIAILSLGQMCRYFNEDLKAEMALFEALFILDRTAPYVKGVPIIACDFGTKTLIEYATALVGNNKYPYAALTYLAAVKNHKMIHQEYDYALISELAELSSKNEDWKRSCFYLRKLLKYNMKQGGEMNIPKVVYLSEKLSEEYMERGDFRSAEYYITTSVAFVKYSGRANSGSTSPIIGDYSKTGDTELNLQLKLANLFLQGYYFERGIDLLARIIEEKLTPMQRCLVLTNLAEAYLKKRWLKECEFVLNKLGPLLEPHIINSGDAIHDLKILEIAARCYLRRSKYHYAMFCVNTALQRCSIPAKLANLFLLKGKIFQAVCHSKNPVPFPLSFAIDRWPSERDESNSFFQQFYREENDLSIYNQLTARRSSFITVQREVYRDASQLLQDCIYCFEKAVSYYTAISDEINIAKVHLEIAKAQLDYVFSEVSFLNGDPVSCSKLQSAQDNTVQSHEFKQDFISLKDIENDYIISSLDTAVRTTHIMLSLNAYITMAECRYLQGRIQASQSFWSECRDVLFTLFLNESEVVVSKGAPPGFLEKLLSILTRLVRLMFCYPPAFVNKNLSLVDALLLLEVELEQVLKRCGESSTEATFNADSGNDSPSDGEGVDEVTLISQNKIYEALPVNSSVSRGKSLPFLRRNRKKASLKLAGRTRKPAYGGSLKGSQSGSKMDGYLDAVYMTERITERVWSCFYRMKQHSRKYSGQTLSERDLCFKNQQSMRRLYNLMLAIRGKKISSLSPTGSSNSSNPDKRNSGTSDKNSTGKNRYSKNYPEQNSLKIDEDVFVDQIDKKISHMSLVSGDMMLVNCFLKTWGEEEGKKLLLQSVDPEEYGYESHEQKDISLVEETSTVHPKLLSRLVYILLVEHVVVYYIPATGRKNFHQLGGRRLAGKAMITSERSGKSLSDPNLVSGSSMLKLSGSIVSETSKTFGGSQKKVTGTGTTGTGASLKDQATKYLFDQLDNYLNALLVQGTRDKRAIGLDQTEATLDFLQTSLFTNAPFDYRSSAPNASQNVSPSNKGKFDYKSLIGKKSSRLVMSFTRTTSKNIALLPKLEDTVVSDQPLLLLCSHALQLIPWELMFSEFMTRTFSLQNISKQKQLKDRYTPAFFSFFSEDESKFIAPLEKKRKEWLYYYVKKKLGLAQAEPGIFHDALPNLPLHSPLITYGKKPSKSKKFKDINFVKLSMVSENPTQIITHIESFLNTPQYPVFLFTLADLVDLSEAILCILSYRPDCTLVFIAEGMISQATEMLLELQAIYGKNEQLKVPMNAYRFFAHCITVLHKELHIPAVVINPPLP